MRIIASIGTLLTVALACATPVQAQEFPSRPVKLIVPYAAGGGTDIVARIVAQKLQDKWGPAVIVENRAGAGGNVGAEAVFTAAPDGYTLLFTAQGPLVVNQYLFEKMAYEPEKFTPVSLVVVAYSALLANPKVPAQDLRELIAYAKANPGKLNYASQGIGTAAHLIAELFKSMADVQINHIPYRGGGPAVNDLVAGHVDLMFAELASAHQYPVGPVARAGGEQRQADREPARCPCRLRGAAGLLRHVVVGDRGAARHAGRAHEQDFCSGRRRHAAARRDEAADRNEHGIDRQQPRGAVEVHR
jgi:tripartite-type tricarboxylate transporter receptor subunit TctC